ELHLVATAVGHLVGHVPDVGDVHDPPDRMALEPQGAPNQIDQHERPHVPDVDVAADGRAARVDLDGPAIDGDHLANLTREPVVQAHRRQGYPADSRTPASVDAR